MTPERFGHYLLLKKLAEDPLGELFRAAQIGDGGLERVVLLRVFNGSALEGRSLISHLEGRESIHGALRNPNIGMGLELGQVQGVPFVAYDYISGKNVGVLLDQIVQRGQAVPPEHALLVVERAALAVAVAFETRVADQRVVHGFLVPHLVMLSNEGETRVLGFEVGIGLRSVLPASPALSTEYGRYLSPEAQGGAALQPNDDVYSLGVLLLELLLGRRIPSPRAEGYRPGYPEQVEAVMRQGPDGIGALLSQSLGPASERIPEVVSWHRTLSKVLTASGHTPTTFNLAFFMHSLFAEDIERESQELEAESNLDLSAIASPSAAFSRALAVSEPEITAPPVEVTGSHPAWSTTPAVEALVPIAVPEAPPPALPPAEAVVIETHAQRRRPSLRRLLPVVALVLMLGGAGGYWLWERSRPIAEDPVEQVRRSAPQPVPSATAPTTVDQGTDLQSRPTAIDSFGAVGTSPDVAQPPLPAEQQKGSEEELLLERLDAMVSQRTSAVEAALRQQYDGEIEALRTQLEEARAEQQLAAAAAEASTPPEEQNAAAQSTPQRRATEIDAPLQPTPGNPATSTVRPPIDPDSVDPGATDAGQDSGTPFPVDQPPSAPSLSVPETTNQPSDPSATAPSEPPPERVRLGDLVVRGPGVVPPALTRQLQPRFPDMARRLNRQGVVTVEVLVDEDGRVRDTRVVEEAGYGFDEAATTAAKRARFEPATKNGVRVRMWTRLKVSFQTEGG